MASPCLSRAAFALVATAAVMCSVCRSSAQPALGNDFFTNAYSLNSVGVSGTLDADNNGASLEPNEPVVPGTTGGSSVWFLWTAPNNGAYSFDTIGSTLDTTLGVYTGNSVDTLAVVAQNDDIDTAAQIFVSRVTFVAQAGTTYYIAVDSYDGSQGDITLNWGPDKLFSGDFGWTSGLYIFGDQDALNQPIDGNARKTSPFARMTVTRKLGLSGAVNVYYSFTNLMYTNYLFTNFFGTNIFITNQDMVAGQTFFTNILSTNVAWTNYYENNEYGQFGWFLQPGAYTYNCTNGHLLGPTPVSLCSSNLLTPPPTNWVFLNLQLPPTNVVTTNAQGMTTSIVSYRTNIFSIARNITNFVPSTINYTIFTNSGFVSGDDFQSGIDVPMLYNDISFNLQQVNAVLLARIDEVDLDDSESVLIPVPTVNTNTRFALVNVLNRFAQGGTNDPGAASGVIPGIGSVRVPDNTGRFITPLLPIAPGAGIVGTNIFNFERAVLDIPENVVGGVAHIPVRRTGNNIGNTSATISYRIDFHPTFGVSALNNFRRSGASFSNPEIPLQAGSEYATPDDHQGFSSSPVDYTNVTGTLTFGPGTTVQFIDIPINNDTNVEFNEDLELQLFDPATDLNQRSLGYLRDSILTIHFHDRAAGAVDPNFNPYNDASTDPPYNFAPGANGPVKTLLVQSDDKIVIGGGFSAYDTHIQNHITRLNTDGSIDTVFTNSIGSGADDAVTALGLDNAGRIYLGGKFSSFNGTSRSGLARLNANGGLDPSFNPAPGVPFGAMVLALAPQPDGKIIVAGDFTSFGGTNRQFIARLNPNGSIDPSFDPGTGPNAKIETIALQNDGKVLIGGDFSSVSGFSRNHIARLNTDGTLDTSFNPATGADGVVWAIKVQNDGKVLIGGDFNNVQAINRKGICRLNADGSFDLSFDPGSGADDIVYSITLQPDGNIILGGLFKYYNQTRRVGVARIYSDGSLDTSFMDTAYNEFAGVPNHLFNPEVNPPNFVSAAGLESDGSLVIGGTFELVGGGGSRDAETVQFNVARLLGGSTPGPGNIQLAKTSYTADENSSSMFVTMVRTNGSLGAASVTIEPIALAPGSGSAVPGVDYAWNPLLPNNNPHPRWPSSYDNFNVAITWQLQDAYFGQNQGVSPAVDPALNVIVGNNDTSITIINNTNVDGNRQLNIQLSNPSGFDELFLGGQNIPVGVALGPSLAQMTIIDDDANKGILGFSVSNFTVSESGKTALITVTRTNGSSDTVQVGFTTSDGTAVAPGDYAPTNGTLTFGPGVTSRSFTISIVNDSIAEDDETINLLLFNPTGGARLGLSAATLTIIDNDSPNGRLDFASDSFSTNENAGAAIITVNRNGASSGTLVVYYAAYDTNTPSLNGTNFIAVTNTLTWNSGDVTPKTFTVPLLDNTVVDGNHAVNLLLFSATVNGATNASLIGSVSNAVLTIIDDDAYGSLAFTRPVYNVMENGGPATITVRRSSGISEGVTVNFSAIADSATAGFDFTPTNGVLNFAAGEIAKSFTIPIIDHPPSQVDASNRTVILSLFGPTPNASVLGTPFQATLNILDDETFSEPAGTVDGTLDPNAGFDGDVYTLALQTNGMILAGGDFLHADNISRNRIARLNPNGSLDPSFSSPSQGANASVRTLTLQSDNRIVIGGFFTNVNGNVLNHIARLNPNGALDSTFAPGAGADNNVFALSETFAGDGSRKLLVGGAFLNLRGVPRSRIGRLNDDGTIDTSFSPVGGADGTVYAIAVYPTNSVRSGQVIIGGDFTSINGVGRNHIARLNPDGTLDLSFNPPSGANDSVRAVAIQTDEHILIGGLFTNVNSSVFPRIARLLPSGVTDASFNPGLGANDIVNAITLQTDNKILLGGQFTSCSGVTRNRLTRLNADGSVDPTINFGLGADSFVSAVLVQPDDKIVIGGGFTHYDGAPAPHFTRIYGRSINGSGTFEFDSPTYTVNENGANAVVTIRRRGGTSGFPTGNVFVTLSTSNGTAVAGVNYSNVVTTMAFPPGEVVQSVSIPIINDFIVNADRTFTNYLSNPQPPGGPALGNQSASTVFIINDDSAISFKSPNYSINEDVSSGLAQIELIRIGSVGSSATVDFTTTTNGTAVPGVNYNPTNATIFFAQGQTNTFVQVPVLHDPSVSGDRTVSLALTNAAGSLLISPSQATLTIVDVEQAPGQFLFSTNSYLAGEGDGFIPITVLRTNGHHGVVTVHFDTVPVTAVPGVHYITTNNTLTFADGITALSFNIRVIDDNLVQGARSLNVVLSAPTGGANILSSNASVTIFDNDMGISLSSPTYSVGEGGGSITIPVQRLNVSNGVVTVHYGTSNGSATAPSDYTSTSGTLVFANGETLKTFSIPIIQDTLVEGDETFNVTLSNLVTTNGAQLVTSSATVTILDDDPAVYFSNAVYTVTEGGTNVVLTVLRTNAALAGTNTISFFTTDGSATVAGGDYVGTSGTLTFTNGENFKNIIIPINQDTFVEGDEFFTVSLATNALSGNVQLFEPSVATVTILDDDSGLRFSSPNYSVSESGVTAAITVLRSGALTNTISVDFSTANGTATAGADYFATNGTLTFTNGEISKSFTVRVIDDTIIEGDETVLLSLSNPLGQASLVNPSAAVLTISDNDGSLIVAAGSALTSDPNGNGVIDPGETVTMLLALRNSKGSPTTNLVATLQANSSVTPITSSQSYGALVQEGPSVSRPFTFTANGTNGGVVTVTLALTDGSSTNGFPSTATFTYSLGTSTSRFTNSGPITILDNTNASPYPSQITVSNLTGVITKTTLSISNFSHTHPADVNILLASPGGASAVLMANAGGGTNVQRANLTFDDSAGSSLPLSSQILSGSYKPTTYPPVAPFPSPAPAAPYGSTMSAFNNFNPNGIWNLFVLDDTSQDTGGITNGWILALTTANVVQPAADLTVAVSDAPDPVVVGSNLTYSVSVTNFGPATASAVTLTAILPPNLTNISASIGGYTLAGTAITFTNLGSLAKDARVAFTISGYPSSSGVVSNLTTVAANETDPFTGDNAATNFTSVVAPSADVSLSLSGTPDPVSLGGNITYSMSVSNGGPATATSVRVTNTLPASVTIVSTSPGASTNGNVVIFDLGTLGSGVAINRSIVARANSFGQITDSASVGSAILDPFKVNNTASIKIIVEPVLLSVSRSGNSVTLSWPASAAGYVLEASSSLTPQSWAQISVPPPTVIGDQKVVTLGASNSARYFRLHSP